MACILFWSLPPLSQLFFLVMKVGVGDPQRVSTGIHKHFSGSNLYGLREVDISPCATITF